MLGDDPKQENAAKIAGNMMIMMAIEEADALSGKPLPMLDALRARIAEAVDAGRGEQDWLAVAAYTLDRGAADARVA